MQFFKMLVAAALVVGAAANPVPEANALGSRQAAALVALRTCFDILSRSLSQSQDGITRGVGCEGAEVMQEVGIERERAVRKRKCRCSPTSIPLSAARASLLASQIHHARPRPLLAVSTSTAAGN
ncbi:hypothetical protein MSAN_00772200 [Mycena sanguinolenta]|uniref:Uncharacterized protein n=1 Tax=Mycena sanguinolenta TaxID=230812 RepID=A0A8H6Z7R0_9AGAR|nr:hypothetical protein MSAN_00772200 [Mycena sanguinolenta]